MQKRRLEYADLYRLHFYSDACCSPDGKSVAYVDTRMLREENRYASAVRIWHSGETHTMEGEAKHPRWCGGALYYLARRPEGWQVCRREADGAVQQLTQLCCGVERFSVSPHGKLCLLVRERTAARDPLAPVVVEGLYVKEDGEKGLIDRSLAYRLYLQDPANSAPQPLLPNDFRLEAPMWGGLDAPVWDAAGERIAFTARAQDDAEHERRPWQANVYVLEARTLQLHTVTQSNGVYEQPVWKDAGTLLCLGHHNAYFRSTDLSIYELPLEGGAERNLTAAHDMTLGNECIGDSEYGAHPTAPVYDAACGALYALETRAGSVRLIRYKLKDDSVTPLAPRERAVLGFSMDAACACAALVYSDAGNPARVALLDVKTGRETVLADENAALLEAIALSAPERLPYAGARGVLQEGWVMKPADWQEGGHYPAVLEIHGGPYGCYGNVFFFEFQLLCAAGLGVFYCNPVGSKGYGQQFSYGVVGQYAKRDCDDIFRFTEACLAHCAWMDAARLGVTGGSYGGYLTNWIITQTNRFRAAVAQRSISNWMTMFATSDSGYVSIEQMLLGRPMHRLEELLTISPVVYAGRVNTPLLLLHSECDMRCPIEQAEQFYVALKAMGKDVRMVRFPASNHGLSRSGLPQLREARLAELVGFLCQHLQA